jgi:hypothetical protein
MIPAIQNLLNSNILKAADRNEAHIEQWISVAESKLADAGTDNLSPDSRFTLAYEGIHSIAMAFLNHHGARTGESEGHRSMALQLAAQELDFCTSKMITDMHRARNHFTYEDPLPPVSEGLARGTVHVLRKAVKAIREIVPTTTPGIPPPGAGG